MKIVYIRNKDIFNSNRRIIPSPSLIDEEKEQSNNKKLKNHMTV